MSTVDATMGFRLRVSGALIIAGLLVEAASLVRIHALAFLAFMLIGGTFLIAGIATYLITIVSLPANSAVDTKEAAETGSRKLG